MLQNAHVEKAARDTTQCAKNILNGGFLRLFHGHIKIDGIH